MVGWLFDELRRRDRWLLIYDNAESPVGLGGLLPAGGGGHVLITSRWSAWADRAAVISLDVLVRQESVAFLARRTGTAATSADEATLVQFGDVAALLGDLPLALAEAAAYLDTTHTSPADYLQLLRNRAHDLFGLDSPGHGDAAGRDRRRVATVWTLSLDRVREHAPAAQALLTLLAFLAADVPRTLPAARPSLLPEPLAAAVADPITYNELVAVIGRYSLTTTTPVQLSMHRLVQNVIQAQLDSTEQQAWALAAVNLIHQTFPSDSGEVTNWPECDRLLPHLIAVTGHAHRLDVAGQQAGWLLDRASTYLRERGQLDQAKPVAEQALAATEDALGADHVDVAWRHDTLGRALYDLGNLNGARYHHERALRIGEAAHSADHDDIAVWHSGLGLALQAAGDLNDARHHFEQALRISQAILAPDHPTIGARLSNLGCVLHELGDLNGARQHHERVLRICQASLSSHNPIIGTYRSNLGRVLRDLGDLASARDHHEQALRISQTALGADHPVMSIRHNNLGSVLHDLGDLNGAHQHYEQALRIAETALNPEPSHRRHVLQQSRRRAPRPGRPGQRPTAPRTRLAYQRTCPRPRSPRHRRLA